MVEGFGVSNGLVGKDLGEMVAILFKTRQNVRLLIGTPIEQGVI